MKKYIYMDAAAAAAGDVWKWGDNATVRNVTKLATDGCLVMSDTGHLAVKRCHLQLYFVCERSVGKK